MSRSKKILVFNVLAIVLVILAVRYWPNEAFIPAHFSILKKDVKGLSLGGLQVGQTVDEIRNNLKPGWILDGDEIRGEAVYIYITFDSEREPKTVKAISSGSRAGLCYDQHLILPRKSMASFNLFLKGDLNHSPSKGPNQVYVDPKDNRTVSFFIFHGNVKTIFLE